MRSTDRGCFQRARVVEDILRIRVRQQIVERVYNRDQFETGVPFIPQDRNADRVWDVRDDVWVGNFRQPRGYWRFERVFRRDI